MPARTPAQAVREFVDPLQRVLSCVTRSILVGEGYRPQVEPFSLVLGAGTPVRLQGVHEIGLVVRYRYVVREAGSADTGWRAASTAYEFTLLQADEHELLAYHWHPTGRSPIIWPHLHVSGPSAPIDLTRGHLPTGPISLPAVLRYAIADLGVRPLRADWPAVLAAAERALKGEPSP